MMFVDLHSKGDEKYAHLTTEEAAKAGAAAVEAQAWMEKNMNEQVRMDFWHSFRHKDFGYYLYTGGQLPNLDVTITENDFAGVISHGQVLEKLLFPFLMSLRSNLYVISVCK